MMDTLTHEVGRRYFASRGQARKMIDGDAAQLFAYSVDDPPPGGLFTTLKIGTKADLGGPKGKAAVAALALQHGVSQAVAVELPASRGTAWRAAPARTWRSSR